MMRIDIPHLADLPVAAQKFFNLLEDKKIVAFQGEMGAGKTTFILELLRLLGVENPNGSPTYSLENSYLTPKHGVVHHYDLYRLNSLLEAYDIGIEEVLYGNEYCFIEWPEKIKKILPDDTIWVYLRTNEDDSRLLTVEL